METYFNVIVGLIAYSTINFISSPSHGQWLNQGLMYQDKDQDPCPQDQDKTKKIAFKSKTTVSNMFRLHSTVFGTQSFNCWLLRL